MISRKQPSVLQVSTDLAVASYWFEQGRKQRDCQVVVERVPRIPGIYASHRLDRIPDVSGRRYQEKPQVDKN
jgi:hypothetical protein